MKQNKKNWEEVIEFVESLGVAVPNTDYGRGFVEGRKDLLEELKSFIRKGRDESVEMKDSQYKKGMTKQTKPTVIEKGI